MVLPTRPVTLAGRRLADARHVCAFFNSDDEGYQTLLPFVKEGIAQGEMGFHVVDPALEGSHVQRLRRDVPGMEHALHSGQMTVQAWEDVQLKRGFFDQQAMLALIERVLNKARHDGYPLVRYISSMEWCLHDAIGAREIVEYESRLNYLLQGVPDAVICTYDVAKHRPEVVLGAFRTHPAVIVGGILQVNPFFTPPDEFLADYPTRPPSGIERTS